MCPKTECLVEARGLVALILFRGKINCLFISFERINFILHSNFLFYNIILFLNLKAITRSIVFCKMHIHVWIPYEYLILFMSCRFGKGRHLGSFSETVLWKKTYPFDAERISKRFFHSYTIVRIQLPYLNINTLLRFTIY